MTNSGFTSMRLTQGYMTIVSREDTDLADQKWYAVRHGKNHYYAARMAGKPRRQIHMHRVILERMIGRTLEPGEYVDHINGDGMDNRRSNLRIVNKAQNAQNSRRFSSNTSGYKGVYWHKRKEQWAASIRVGGKRKHLGYYNMPQAAFAAYCKAANHEFGEFARFK